MDWKPLFMGGDGYSPNMFEIAGSAMEGTYWVYPMNVDDPAFDPIKAAFKKEYGRDATEVSNVVYAYDVLLMIAHAIEAAGVAEGPAIRDALENTRD